jgi:hypothetical protein
MINKTKNNMKHSLSTLVLVLSTLTLLPSCSHKTTAVVGDSEKVTEPFSSPEYRSDSKHVRYVGTIESDNITSAKQAALIEAQSGIALLSSKKIEGMFTDYLDLSNTSNKNESAKHIQSLFDGIVQIRLPFTRIIGEELYKNKSTGQYTSYIAIEVSVEELEKESLRILQTDARIKNLVSEKGYRELLDKKLQQNQPKGTTENNH